MVKEIENRPIVPDIMKILIYSRYGVALYHPPGNFPLQYAANVQQRSDLEEYRLA